MTAAEATEVVIAVRLYMQERYAQSVRKVDGFTAEQLHEYQRRTGAR